MVITRALNKNLNFGHSKYLLSEMNLLIVIMAIVCILFTVFYGRYKLKDAEEGDLIDIGFGTHVEYEYFELRLTIALLVELFVLLVGLVS